MRIQYSAKNRNSKKLQTSTNIQQKFDIQREFNIRPFNNFKIRYSTRILLNTQYPIRFYIKHVCKARHTLVKFLEPLRWLPFFHTLRFHDLRMH